MKQIFKLIIIALITIPVFSFSQTKKEYIMVSYSSICCGTPSEKPIMDFVKKFEIENKLPPFEIFVEYGLGDEGEHAFYIGTDNLNPKSIKSFVKGLKITATKQNNKRLKNRDGSVNVDDKLTLNATLKSIKNKPINQLNSLTIYNYKQ
ncbi:hypothetical protein [Chryseobacterium gambrini]|uniref:Uncharacterized protein n=1 Tax=Chryseobacterium gambrini TaxID=373672 RepID=A0ABM8K638_9FLAO|nr:hypothetical protein CRDW_18660 [Chryseobacterium gambrini]